MANKWLKGAAMTLALLAAFAAGGWFFHSWPRWSAGSDEVSSWYVEDGESVGIFDRVSPQDLAAAQAVADGALKADLSLPEEEEPAPALLDGRELPSQIVLTPMSDIAAVISKPAEEEEENPLNKNGAVQLNLKGTEVASVPGQDLTSLPEGEKSHISMIAAPVKYLLIKNADDYKAFKTRARGSYPEINFDKQMAVVLESDSNFPDNAFEIRSVKEEEGLLRVLYAVNVFGLNKKTNTHALVVVDKTSAEPELKQVL